jgi:hypothetical protein
MPADVFISYSVQDMEIAGAACAALEGEGISCWIAPRDVLPGVAYADSIIEALNNCKVFLIILSTASNTSPQVTREVERAVSKDLCILTFRIDDAILSKAMEYFLSDHHWLDASQDVLSRQMHGLAGTVKELLNRVAGEGRKAAEKVPALSKELETPQQKQPKVPAGRKPALPWIIGVIGLIILAGVIFGFFKFLPPTASVIQSPPQTTAIKSTPAAQSRTSTASPQPDWVGGFSEPILQEVNNLRPNLADDFSVSEGASMRWYYGDGVSFINGGLRMDTTGTDWVGVSDFVDANDFVLVLEFTPRLISSGSMMNINFRSLDRGSYGIWFNLYDTYWEVVRTQPSQDYTSFGRGTNNQVHLDRMTGVMVIARGGEFAFYLNCEPLFHLMDSAYPDGDMYWGVWSPEGPSKVDFDNIKIWDLNNLNR